MVKWKPTGWAIMVKPEYTKEVDFGGGKLFEIVQTDRQGIAAVQTGEVLAVGPDAYKGDRFTSGPWCKVGDRVIYAKYGGMILEDPETKAKVVLLNDEDIKGVY